MAEIVVCTNASKCLQIIAKKATGVRPDAITLGGTIFYLDPPKDPAGLEALRRHEHKHLEQQAAYAPWWARLFPLSWRASLGFPLFAPRYIEEHLRHGYEGNKYEIEARVAEI